MGDERGDDAADERRADDYSSARIGAAAALTVVMNEWVFESIECSGSGTEPFTDAQFERVAHLVAAASRALGLPIKRSTVVVQRGHQQRVAAQ